MTAESLMQMCAELGIKLALAGDDSDRLQVDAPKGALPAALRDALAAHKSDLISFLKTRQEARRPTRTSTFEQDSEVTANRVSSSTTENSPEATSLIPEHPLTSSPERDSTAASAFGKSESEQPPIVPTHGPVRSGIDSGLAEILEEFRIGAEGEGVSSNEDYETHYNKATAYKEMDLLDEAIREFQIAAGLTRLSDGTPRYFQCCNMLGHCFVQKGTPRDAVLWFKKALDAPGRNAEEYKALQYELASAYEAMGDVSRAVAAFAQVYRVDVGYRDIAEKFENLQARAATQKKKKPDVEVSKLVSASDYDEAIHELLTADSPAERAAAARKLGILRDPKATAHLIASLQDGAPEVRRAATESLGQMGDASAIAPLNELLLREASRQLPEAVIRHAINSITVTEVKRSSVREVPALLAQTPVVKTKTPERLAGEPPVAKTETPAASTETPPPKREIFADYLRSFEERAPLTTPVALPGLTMPPASTKNSLDAAEEELRQEEEALGRAADALERKRAEAEAARAKAEKEVRIKAESEAQLRMEIEARIRAEEEARVKGEQEARSRAEEEALRRAEEEARFRLEAETLRKAAEELARKRSEAEAARKLAAEQERLKAEHEARLRAEEEALARVAEAARRQKEDEMRRRVAEENRRMAEEKAAARAAEEARMKAVVEARVQSELETKRKAEEEALRRAERELTARAAEEGQRRAEKDRARLEAEQNQRVEEARLRAEQETLMQVAADLSRRRSELEAARQKAEAEEQLLIEAEERAAEEELRRQLVVERQRLELETERRAEEERLAESRRRAAEEQTHAAEQARVEADEAERRLADLESVRERAREDARGRAEKEQHIKAEIFALVQAEEEQRNRIEVEIKRRTEAEVRLREQEAQAEEEALRVSEEIRSRSQEQARRRAEFDARLREEEALLEAELEAHAKAEEDARRLVFEARTRAEDEARRRAEAEARLQEEEDRLQAEQEARVKAEEEGNRLIASARERAEEESRLRAEADRVKEEARLQVEQEARVSAEAEARARAEDEAQRRAKAEGLVKEEVARLQADQEARARAEEEARRVVENARVKAEQEAQSQSSADSFTFETAVETRVPESAPSELSWVDVDVDSAAISGLALLPVPDGSLKSIAEPSLELEKIPEPVKGLDVVFAEKGIASAEDDAGIPADILKRLNSADAGERAAGLAEAARVGGDDAFRCLSRAFDDQSADVRNAAARALFALQSDRAATFTRALREGSPERRRKIGQALAASGLATEAVGNLTGASREKTYDAFSLLFLMAKAGEIKPLMQAIEDYPNPEVRIAVVKLLALSGQPEIVPAFRRLAVRGSLPSEVRSAVMEAIYQISSQARESTPSAA